MSSTNLSVGFIGAGLMASAMMDGMIAKGVVVGGEAITASDVYEPSRKKAEAKGVNATESNQEVCSRAKDVIILAVKPNVIADVCQDVMKVPSEALVISIAAGVTLNTLQTLLPGRRVVRVMPNTPCVVGEVRNKFMDSLSLF